MKTKIKSKVKFALLLAGAALAFQCQAVTYSFTGFFGEPLPDGQLDQTASFMLSLPDFITSNTQVLVTSMDSCQTPASPCANATFHVDAAADGLTDEKGVQALELSSLSGYTFYYYFAPSAFGSAGTYDSLYGFDSASLVAAVPEPGSYALMALGLGLIAVRSWRRRPSAGVAPRLASLS